MKNNTSKESTNFWFGFSMGIATLSLLFYFFGTKEGRKLLKRIIELTEKGELTKELNKILEKDTNLKKDKKGSSTLTTVIKEIESLTK